MFPTELQHLAVAEVVFTNSFCHCKQEVFKQIYCIYWNARWGIFLKFGTYICKVILNSRTKPQKPQTRWYQAGSLWTGPCIAKPRLASPYRNVRSVFFWDIMQQSVVIPFQYCSKTYWHHLQRSTNKKERTWNDWHQSILFLWLCPSSNILRKHDVSETGSVSVFMQRTT